MKKLPIIRHVRYVWYSWRLMRWMSHYQSLGLGFFPQESDLQFLNEVWYGSA